MKRPKHKYRLRDASASLYASSLKRKSTIIIGPAEHYLAGWDTAAQSIEELKTLDLGLNKDHQELFNNIVDGLVGYLTE